ncbi:hypothetical protein FRB99_001131 [Tulasnella sp. 403]|nr:hypothetical protein FRB99_001131 [Tulasnella sp. 403]
MPVLLYLTTRFLRPKPLPGIPHYPVTSFFGDIMALGTDAVKYGTPFSEGAFFWTSVEKLGPIYQVFMGPLQPSTVVLADAQEIEDVLLRSRNKSMDICNIMLNLFSATIPLGCMIDIPVDDMWRRHRRVSTALMTSSSLRKMTPSIVANTGLLVEYWREKMRQAETQGAVCFACEDDFEGSTLDTITDIVTGRRLGVTANHLDQLYRGSAKIEVNQHGGAVIHLTEMPLYTALRWLFHQIGRVAYFPPWFAKIYQRLVIYTSSYKQHYSIAAEYIDGCIEEGRTAVKEARSLGEEPSAKTMISWVVEKEVESGQPLLPGREFRDEVLTYIFGVRPCSSDGGHDTTSTVLQWGIKFLSDAPDVQRTLRAELLSRLDDSPDKRPLTFDDMSSEKVPYLEAVVAEMLRHGQVSEATSRTTLEPVTIFGHTIPAGVDIIFMTTAASIMSTESKAEQIRARDDVRSESSLKQGSNTSLWEDDSRLFKPERWLIDDPNGKGRIFNPKAGYNMPFGVGPRSCAGKQLAQLELKLFIATLNLAFFFEKVPAELGGYKPVARLTRGPSQSYVAPRAWKA